MRSIKFLWLAGLLLGSGLAQADQAGELFERMRQAMVQQDYEGRFVYQVGSQLQSMYVVHRVNEGAELERLVALNGSNRQVIRGDRAVACLVPGKHRMSVIEGASADALGLQRPVPLDELQQAYEFSLGDEERVAGRKARVLHVRPRDQLRFAHDLYLDEQTGLPLRSVMLDDARQVRSQMMFVELRTGDDVTPIEHDVTALNLADAGQINMPASPAPADSAQWTFDGLPVGFRLAGMRNENEAQRQHFLLTDGLAVVSLYIEPAAARGMNGFSSRGATAVYGENRHGHQVTAIGEVPKDLLQIAVRALQPK